MKSRIVRLAGALALTFVLVGCGGTSQSPTAPTQTPQTTTTTPAAPAPAPPAPAPAPTPTRFAVRMPIDQADLASAAYGLWPFGTHGGGHAFDGHPGWDVEFRPGGTALVASDGTVQMVFPDAFTPGRFTVQIEHEAGGKRYRTVYTNVETVAREIQQGARVMAGQRIGTPGVQSAMIGRTNVTYGMIHFQVDDFSQNSGQTNQMAVGPAQYLDEAGRAMFNQIWPKAKYYGELCEPFDRNPRDAQFPLTRTWTLESGALPQRIDFTRLDPTTNDYAYALIDGSGRTIESGTLQIEPTATPLATIDFQPRAGAPRRGVYDIVSDRMDLALGEAGASRPANLAGAAVYRTR